MTEMPRWQRLCYRQTGWRQNLSFFAAGLFCLSPPPHFSARKPYNLGGAVAFTIVVASIPTAIFVAGFVVGAWLWS